jgi:hypothetical protein
MNADGSDPIRLTDVPAIDAEPDFSPGGKFIAFAHTPLLRNIPAGCEGTCVSLQLMRSDGSDLINVRSDDFQGAVSHPTFAPDGRGMAYVICTRPFGCRVVASELNVLRGRPLGLTITIDVPRDTFSSDLMPAWQPIPRAR